MLAIDALIAAGVVLATAATDAVYVMFTSAVVARRRMHAASWSSVRYLLSSWHSSREPYAKSGDGHIADRVFGRRPAALENANLGWAGQSGVTARKAARATRQSPVNN
jgi:hypothetical protein